MLHVLSVCSIKNTEIYEFKFPKLRDDFNEIVNASACIKNSTAAIRNPTYQPIRGDIFDDDGKIHIYVFMHNMLVISNLTNHILLKTVIKIYYNIFCFIINHSYIMCLKLKKVSVYL